MPHLLGEGYGETELQCVQKTTVCPISAEQNIEITRGELGSSKNIRKRKGRDPSSSNWSPGGLWRLEDYQRRHLIGRRRLPSNLQQRQAGRGDTKKSVQSHLEKDGQDVMDWGQSKWRMTKEYTNGTETVLARLARPDWKISQASECVGYLDQ